MKAIRILVVDDEESIRNLFAYFLTSQGYQVRTAAEGAEALAALEREPIDLVLTDLGMRGMDGRTLLAALRARGSSIPVVVMTATGAGAAISQEFGAVASLAKPFPLAELATLVQSVVETGGRAHVLADPPSLGVAGR